MEHVRTGSMNCFQASREYGIPYRALKRRLEKNDDGKHGLGLQSKELFFLNLLFYTIFKK
jgi:hypothetical protein